MSQSAQSLLSVHNAMDLGSIFGGTDKEIPKAFISNIYDPTIGHLKSTKLKMLEIGVRGGGRRNYGFHTLKIFTCMV